MFIFVHLHIHYLFNFEMQCVFVMFYFILRDSSFYITRFITQYQSSGYQCFVPLPIRADKCTDSMLLNRCVNSVIISHMFPSTTLFDL